MGVSISSFIVIFANLVAALVLSLHLYLVLTHHCRLSFTKVKLFSLGFFALLLIGAYYFPCPWGFFKVRETFGLSYKQGYFLAYNVVLAILSYLYSSRNWQVLYAVVAYSYLSIFFIFFEALEQVSYIFLGIGFAGACLVNSVLWCGGFIAWSRFVAESYLEETHAPLSFASFSELWVDYLNKVRPAKIKALRWDRSALNAFYTGNIFFAYVGYGLAYKFLGFLMLGTYLKAGEWGNLALFFLMPLFCLHMLTFDSTWKANFEKAYGEKSLHRLGYNGAMMSLAKRGDPGAVTAIATSVAALGTLPGALETLASFASSPDEVASTPSGNVSADAANVPADAANGPAGGEVCPVDIASPSPILIKGAVVINPNGDRFTLQSTFMEPTPPKDPEKGN